MNHLEHLTCECCGKQPVVGVCSTIIPYSAAFCKECLENRAQPRWVIDYVFQENLECDLDRAADWLFEVKVWLNGKYVTFKEYVEGVE